MRPFEHINAATLGEASAALREEGAVAMAGGGDLIGALKDDIFPVYPKTVVNLKSIAGMDGIRLDGGVLKIGALATLADVACSPAVQRGAKALADAAGAASSPTLRYSTTIGGNICQMPRCWYFRKLGNRFCCARKGGTRCFAVSGDSRYHSVFGGASFETGAGEKRTCIAAHQSDAAPVLTALRAKLKTTERLIDAADFFSVGVLSSTALEAGEILTEIQIPVSEMSMSCRYKRFAFRKSIDFPVLSVTVAKDGGKNYAVALGGAAPVPYRAAKAEELLKGSDNTPETAAAAGEAAIAGAKPYSANAYKLQIIKTLVKRELMAMSQTAANQSF